MSRQQRMQDICDEEGNNSLKYILQLLTAILWIFGDKLSISLQKTYLKVGCNSERIQHLIIILNLQIDGVGAVAIKLQLIVGNVI